MSGPQSFFDKVRDTVSGTPPPRAASAPQEPEPPDGTRTLIGAATGAVIGLILGLLIGWVLWPVEWTNALPPDLSAAAKADYVSSIADAYVAARNQQAVETAQSRLRYFGSPTEIAAEIEAAQALYAANGVRDAGVRINNMNELASALQLDLVAAPAAVALPSTVVPIGAPTAAPGLDITPVADLAEPVPAEWGWAQWILIMFTGFLLITGGILLLRRLMAASVPGSARQASATGGDENGDDSGDGDDGEEDDVRGFEEETEDAYTASAATDVAYEDTPRQIDAYAQQRPIAPAPPRADPADSYAFEEESADVVGAPTAPISLGLDDTYAESGDVAGEDDESDDFEDDDFADFDESAEDAGASDANDTVDEDDEDRTAFEDEPVVAAATAAVATTVTSRPRSPGRVLGEFNVRYDHGDPDYDASYNILDAENGNYIGECGMGVNMKNGILQNNPENVVALDVWLFDKTDERKLETKTAVLISPQVIQRDMAKIFGGDRESLELLQPQSNLRFSLEGGHLVLDCVVNDVAYFDANSGDDTAGGVFRTLDITMTVLRRR